MYLPPWLQSSYFLWFVWQLELQKNRGRGSKRVRARCLGGAARLES